MRPVWMMTPLFNQVQNPCCWSSSYGAHPNILATRADYESDVKHQISLLKSAYGLAETYGDQMNKTLIAGSIACIYWEERRDVARTERWLNVLRSCLKAHFDESEHRAYLSLKRQLAAHRRRFRAR